ncbi:hypothetical protein BIW11_04836, partial [Tropilaelaps mercedesae]
MERQEAKYMDRQEGR